MQVGSRWGPQFTHNPSCPSLRSGTSRLSSRVPSVCSPLVVSAGSRVTYTIQAGETLLARSSVVRGDVPHNITVTPEIFQRLGPGCHRLKLVASNMVTEPPLLVPLQVPTLHQLRGFSRCSISHQHHQFLLICLFLAPSSTLKMFVKLYVLFSVRPGMVDHFNMDYFSIRVVEYGIDGICFK